MFVKPTKKSKERIVSQDNPFDLFRGFSCLKKPINKSLAIFFWHAAVITHAVFQSRTAIHLQAVQSIPQEMKNQSEYYAQMLVERKKELQKTSSVMVADAFFSKKTFVDILCANELELISGFRDDVQLKYLIEPVKTGKKGRPKTIGEKIDLDNLDENYFKKEELPDQNVVIYSAVVRAVDLKRNVKEVIVFYQKENKIKNYNIYFSTDIKLDAIHIWDCYQSRFQIEFLYRDTKQYTGLDNCQARDTQKLSNHFNLSLTAINIAKAAHWMMLEKKDRKAFSMQDIKTMNYNALLLQRFLSTFGINPNMLKNNPKVKELLLYGTKAA